MKKKLYIQPNLVVVRIGMNQMICSSIKPQGDNLQITLDDEEFGEGDGEIIN